MRVRQRFARLCLVPAGAALLLCFLLSAPGACAAPPPTLFRVATFNIENYLAQPHGGRPAKSAAGRAAVRASLHALAADIVALQEIGGTNELLELRSSLGKEGLVYPYWELVSGSDTNICVALLSRFPVTRRHPHTNDAFLLLGRKYRVSRGFLEVDLQITDHYSLTLLTAHLKSRRPVPEADEAELREQEALLLREKVDACLKAHPEANLIVLGDFNDTKDTPGIRALVGRGKWALTDTRPSEPSSISGARRSIESRNITWTHYYAKEDTYSRIDYVLISRGLVREWYPAESYILADPDWGNASDHRPLVAAFAAEDR